MAQTLVAIALAKLEDTKVLAQTLDWALGNLHLQHLDWTISAAFANPQGNELTIVWFLENFAKVCRPIFVCLPR